MSASQALMSPLHVPQVLLSCHSHGRGGGRCPHGRFVINLCKTRGESCKNISFSILSSKHPEPTGVGRPRAWHGQGHGAGAWSTVLVHAVSAAAAVSFSCMGWGSWSRAGGLHRGPSSSATCASLQQEVQWEPGRFLRSGADPCGASLWFPPALTSWHSHATCSPVRSSGRAAPAAPPHQHPSGSPWVMRGAGTPWHTQQPLLLALGLFLSCTHCAHCTQRSSCRALCAQTSPCNPRQPPRRASTLHPGDSMCTPCTQLPSLHHSSCTSAAADPAVPRVPSMLPWCCGAPHGAGGGHTLLTNLTCCQLGALPTWCIAANPMHCRPGAFPAPHQRLGEGCWGGCGTACPRMEEPGGGGAADSPSQPCHGRCALGGSRCALSPGAVKNTAPDFNTAAILGAISGWEQEVKPHSSQPRSPLAAPLGHPWPNPIQGKWVYLKPSSRAPAFTFWAFQRSRRMARSPNRSTAPYLNTSL